jgi:hypothetical protein
MRGDCSGAGQIGIDHPDLADPLGEGLVRWRSAASTLRWEPGSTNAGQSRSTMTRTSNPPSGRFRISRCTFCIVIKLSHCKRARADDGSRQDTSQATALQLVRCALELLSASPYRLIICNDAWRVMASTDGPPASGCWTRRIRRRSRDGGAADTAIALRSQATGAWLRVNGSEVEFSVGGMPLDVQDSPGTQVGSAQPNERSRQRLMA